MEYLDIVEGKFIKRLNRFVAEVNIKGIIEKVHVKNTGRCEELFIEGIKVFLEPAKNPDRKTKYSLVALYKKDLLINIDSQIPNYVVKEAMTINPHLIKQFGEITFLKSEVTYGNSRFDLYYENSQLKTKGFIEVKGVTLENHGKVKFPDAPTVRGTKHLNELIKSVEEGYKSYVFFVIQMKGATEFSANYVTDPKFANALIKAQEAGVGILCFDSVVKRNSIVLNEPVNVNVNSK